jgi:hypothetical protein
MICCAHILTFLCLPTSQGFIISSVGTRSCMVFWDVMPCNDVVGYQHFRGSEKHFLKEVGLAVHGINSL